MKRVQRCVSCPAASCRKRICETAPSLTAELAAQKRSYLRNQNRFSGRPDGMAPALVRQRERDSHAAGFLNAANQTSGASRVRRREDMGETSAASAPGPPALRPTVIDRVFAFHEALVPHRRPAQLKIARICQCFALGFEAQRVSLPFVRFIHHNLNLPGHPGLPGFSIATDRVVRGNCTIEAAKLAGSCQTAVVGLSRCPIVAHLSLPIAARATQRCVSAAPVKPAPKDRIAKGDRRHQPMSRFAYCECRSSTSFLLAYDKVLKLQQVFFDNLK